MSKHPTLTKADLIEEVLRISELPRKESETIVETIFESIIDALQKGDKIEIRGFGSFRTRQRRGRIGRNPKTGAKVDVPPKKIPFFKPSKELKDFVNNSESDGTVGGNATGAPTGSTSSAPGNSTHS
jgi:integration host factor subunit beta